MRKLAVPVLAVVLSVVSAIPAAALPVATHPGATTTVYLPNITKMLGGPDGWQTPFIVQNVGTASTDLEIEFYAFADGSLVKTRSVAGLRPGTSVFHDPNSDTGLAPGGQFSVVIRSYGSAVVAVVNEHQNTRDPVRQEALSYGGLASGSRKVYAPYAAKNASGWLTTFVIQNLGTIGTTVSAEFAGGGPGSVTLTRTIGPGRSQFIDPTVENQLLVGAEYAVTFTADQPIGVVVNAHNDAAGVPQPRGFSYNGQPASSEEETYLPYVARRSDGALRTSRVHIQNAGSTSATPRLIVRRYGSLSAAVQITGPAVAPGRVWVWDPTTAAQLTDGDHALVIVDGKFAAVAAALSAATAMGTTGSTAFARRLYLPNVTRTLGGASGWTTPIIVQSTGAPFVTVKWYRFSDGALVHSQMYGDLLPGAATRIDPRDVLQLTDDTQYAVVVEPAAGGAAAVVTEVNFLGGDSGMAYDGAEPASRIVYGTSGCDPLVSPGGTHVHCRFYGLPPGVAPTTQITGPGDASGGVSDEVTAPDGSWQLRIIRTIPGAWTVQVSAGGITRQAQFTVTAPLFTTAVTESTFGRIVVRTAPGAICRPFVVFPQGSLVSGFYLPQRAADGAGNLTFTYTTPAGTANGTGTHGVPCYLADQQRSANASFTVP
ncbi:MAG TPA: hypothetical protein VFM93_03905 [Candidatus Limnocylindria bacterium]|nr:hypothetical protein [Candidatus Limnocylindria bacterium]